MGAPLGIFTTPSGSCTGALASCAHAVAAKASRAAQTPRMRADRAKRCLSVMMRVLPIEMRLLPFISKEKVLFLYLFDLFLGRHKDAVSITKIIRAGFAPDKRWFLIRGIRTANALGRVRAAPP